MNLFPRRHAFTLIEVLIVVAIIGIAGLVVVPQMLRAGTMQAQAAGRIVISEILIAQNEAMARQAVRQVIFEVDQNRYRLADSQGQTLVANWKSGAQYVTDFSQDARFQGVRLTRADFGGQPVLEFDDMGAPVSGGTVELEAPEARYRINVSPFTGRLTIEQVSQ